MRVADGYARGVLDLDHYRGRSGQPFAVQAAESFVRRQERLLGVDDLRLTAWQRGDGDVVEVTLDGPGGRTFDVSVAVRAAEEARPLSCHAAGEERPPTYALVALTVR